MLTITCVGADPVFPNHNAIGVTRATPEATTCYVSNDVGNAGTRASTISTGVPNTFSAHKIAGFSAMHWQAPELALLGSIYNGSNVAGIAIPLNNNLALAPTGE